MSFPALNLTKSKGDILIVDDTPDNLRVLSHMLNLFGYKVRAVTEGALALDVVQTAPPDLIMMDISMPGMDGYTTCKKLKADENSQQIPVIFISAMGEVNDKIEAFRVGGVDYITKPFQIEEVLARIETHLSIRRLQTQLEVANDELARRLEELSVAQAREHEQRLLAETLRDTISAINSTLDFDEVLDLILDNLARVVPHEAANIALVDPQQLVTIQRARGYDRFNVQDILPAGRFPLAQFPFWQEVVEIRQPQVVQDTNTEEEWVPIEKLNWIRSVAYAPIISEGEVIGLLNLDSSTPGFYGEPVCERLQAFADQAAVAIEKARLFQETQRLAITDALTELFNRRHLLKLAELEFERVRRYGRDLSATMIDLDHFKSVNDTFGHPVGDQALKALAKCCRENLRSTDIIGRYGGEEFLILLPETGLEQAYEVAERIRAQVEALRLPTDKGYPEIKISAGIAALQNGAAGSLQDLIRNADDALYAAKAAGRNRVERYTRGEDLSGRQSS